MLNLFYLLDFHEVLYTREHALDNNRVIVLNARIDSLQTQRIEVAALARRSTDPTFDLGDFQSCLFVSLINR